MVGEKKFQILFITHLLIERCCPPRSSFVDITSFLLTDLLDDILPDDVRWKVQRIVPSTTCMQCNVFIVVNRSSSGEMVALLPLHSCMVVVKSFLIQSIQIVFDGTHVVFVFLRFLVVRTTFL